MVGLGRNGIYDLYASIIHSQQDTRKNFASVPRA